MAGSDVPDGEIPSAALEDDSTVQNLWPVRRSRPGLVGRRIVVALLAGVVLLGAANVLGVRSGTATRSADGWTVTVTHATVARAGLDVPLIIEVTAPDGFDQPVELALDRRYFEIFESQRFFPEPDSESADADTWYATFEPPASGSTFQVAYDAYIQPSSQIGRAGSVALLVDDAEVVTVPFRTVLVP